MEIIRNRQWLEQREERELMPWACRVGESLGRAKPEKAHPFRTDFQRDRARIIHSSAFRRLDGKTQVFLNGTGDHFRTRLTHTIEVASVSRTVARALGLNEDLAEAVALAHDLGHSPFGHAGEETLNRLMRGHGGFDHNEQSLRVVGFLEEKYPGVRGLNLSYEVLEGLRKHHGKHLLPDGSIGRQPSLEGQIANVADEITYASHDLDDGLESGLLSFAELDELAIWQTAVADASGGKKKFRADQHRGYVIRCLINRQVEDLVLSTASAIGRKGVGSLADVRSQSRMLVGFSPIMRRESRDLRKFLYRHFYHHPVVQDVHQRFCASLETAFHGLCQEPRLLGRKAAGRIATEGLERTVCDYLSGMTDRYLIRTAKHWA